MEDIAYQEHFFQIPSGICQDSSYLLEIISPDTWNNVLTDGHRQQLMKFLPDFPEDDLNEKTRTLEMFFMNENFSFGSPLQKFFGDLCKGFFNPNVAKLRKINRKFLQKSYRYRQKQYYHRLLEDVMLSRKKLLSTIQNKDSLLETIMTRPISYKIERREACLQKARKRYFRELKTIKSETGCDLEMSEDENYPDGPGLILNKKQRRQLILIESSFPSNLSIVRGTFSKGSLAMDLESRITISENPFDSSDDHLRHLMSDHDYRRKKRSITAAVRGITMQAVLERAQMYAKKPLQRSQLSSIPLQLGRCTDSKKSSTLKRKLKPITKEKLSYKFSVAPTLGSDFCLKSNSFAASKALSSDESSSDEEIKNFEKPQTEESDSSKDLLEERSLFAPELTQETHISFFSLLRDVICSTPNQRMSKFQLESSIKTWQDSAISPLNEWFNSLESWVENLSSAINFLCGNFSLEILPSDFVPYIEHKVSTKCFQWIGAGRDNDSNLEPLCQFWLTHKNAINNVWPTITNVALEDDCKSSVSKNIVPNWSLSSDVVSNENEYHVQERMRYGSPHKAFTYRLKGYESIIGPVKGVYSQQVGTTSKARDHSLLIPSRPPFVTILSLVWDAVSRLTNGEGTKVDICKLVKESQFIVEISTPALENTLTNVVSGALDRLQNEKDPCVKFDTSRKLWVYLHNNRTEEEFERIHHMNGPLSGNKAKSLGSSRKQKVKKDDVEKGPPNVAMEQFSSAIKHMDGSEVRVKDEDLLKNWVKISTAPMKKNETVKITSTQLRADLAKMKAANAKAAAAESGTDSNSVLPKNASLAFKAPLLQSAPSHVNKILGQPLMARYEDVTPITTINSTTLQFSKRVKLVQSSASSSILATSSVNTQGSRKYQSASEKKRLAGMPQVTCSANSSVTSAAIANSVSKAATTEISTIPGIKVLQFSSQNLQSLGKNVIGSTPIVVDASNSVPTALVGQKLVVSGNRLLVHGGKVLHNVSTNVESKGKQLLAGVLPSEQIVAVSNVKKNPIEQHVEGEAGGRFIQIASIDGGTSPGFQKVTFMPQFAHSSVTSSDQKGTDVQNFATAARGLKSTMSSGELKLKLRGTTTFATSSGNITGNLISLGGKQIFLATKGGTANKAAPQFHQVVVGDAGTTRLENVKTVRRTVSSVQQLHLSQNSQQTSIQTTSAGQPVFVSTHSNQQHIIVPVSTSSGQQICVPTSNQQQIVIPTNSTGQQIIVPASALHGSQINIKGLQAIQSFKVVPASKLPQQQKGKPMVAHILTPSTSQGHRSGTTQLALHISTDTSAHVRK